MDGRARGGQPRMVGGGWGPGLLAEENATLLWGRGWAAPNQARMVGDVHRGEPGVWVRPDMVPRDPFPRDLQRELHRFHAPWLTARLSPRLWWLLEVVSLTHALTFLLLFTLLHFSFVGQSGCGSSVFESAAAKEAHIVEVYVTSRYERLLLEEHARLEALRPAEEAAAAAAALAASSQGGTALEAESCRVGEEGAETGTADPAAAEYSWTLTNWVNWLTVRELPIPTRLARPVTPPLKSALMKLFDEQQRLMWLTLFEETLLALSPFQLTEDGGEVAREATMEGDAATAAGQDAASPANTSSTGSNDLDGAEHTDGGGEAETALSEGPAPMFYYSTDLAYLLLTRESHASHNIATAGHKTSPTKDCAHASLEPAAGDYTEAAGLTPGSGAPGSLAGMGAAISVVHSSLNQRMFLNINLKGTRVDLSSEDACFGNAFISRLMENWIGYEVMMVNSMMGYRGCGVVMEARSRTLYQIKCASLRSSAAAASRAAPRTSIAQRCIDRVLTYVSTVFTALFVCGVSTLAVSYTMRETLARMLKCVVQLQRTPPHPPLPTSRLVLRHALESLVFVPIMIGILFFLCDLFDDQLLAALVVTLTWVSELFVLMNSDAAQFPRFFFMAFIVFHLYFFSYPRGYTYLAFYTTFAFLLYTAVHVLSCRATTPHRIPLHSRLLHHLGTWGRR